MYSESPDYYSNPRPEMLEFIPESAKTILDVGCGQGDFAARAKAERHVIAWGVDIDSASVTIAQNRLDNAICGDISTVIGNLPDGYFDVIFFNDSLEHMIDPYKVIKMMKTKLSSKGIVVSSIPNVRYFRNLINLLYRKDWRYEDSGIMDRTHLRFFTKKSILELFEDNGYSVLEIRGIGKTRSIRPFLFNLVTFGAFAEDTRYLQFVTVARSSEPNDD